ncbi:MULTISPECIES: thioredoxin [Haloferax]|uniref:Thioredoxin n=2 Tax=Haloferax TaxID=2251 RepID=A0A6A8GK97_9EURY|nr:MULTISPECIES: thioredoxin [Haloferax]KAB1189853.1 thioredoxin [Haloferax sp. CBA1148]KTG27003.1 thioredoxin [Haloferax profundi]MRX23613.1 thioredoxin [Haloferax litoreum]
MSESEFVTDEPIHVESVEHFQELVDRDGVVLVDFYADWCGPCKMLEPIVENIAADTDAVVLKVDTEELGQLSAAYQVQSIPNVVFFADGEPKKRVVGMRGEEVLRSVVEELSS